MGGAPVEPFPEPDGIGGFAYENVRAAPEGIPKMVSVVPALARVAAGGSFLGACRRRKTVRSRTARIGPAGGPRPDHSET
jgi:hypothetical protein